MTLLLDQDEISLPPSADLHVHLRDGPVMEAVVPTIRQGGVDTVYVMPNLNPPITTVEQALSYRSRLQALDPSVTYLMSLYLHPSITPSVVRAARTAGITGIKSYPAGVTTNSASGVLNYSDYFPVFAAMQEVGLILNLHGECPSSATSTGNDGEAVHVLNAEPLFLPTLHLLHARFPRLRIILEHCTTAAAVAAVLACGKTVAGTITPHHLCMTIDDWVANPFHFCKPVAKLPSDRAALLRVVVSDEARGRFFLGSDSAPHLKGAKRGDTLGARDGTAAGCFTQPYVTQLLLGALEEGVERWAVLKTEEVTTERVSEFVRTNGTQFYGLEAGHQTATVRYRRRQGQLVVEGLAVTTEGGKEQIVPFRAGQELRWSLVLKSGA